MADTPVQAIFNLVTTPCLVPLNRGRTVAEAEFRLELASCQPNRAGLFFYAFSRTVRKGRVLFQLPRSGTQLTHQAMVGLVVSKGRRRR
jgi:beta-lactam-binding protein with PASTA domain